MEEYQKELKIEKDKQLEQLKKEKMRVMKDLERHFEEERKRFKVKQNQKLLSIKMKMIKEIGKSMTKMNGPDGVTMMNTQKSSAMGLFVGIVPRQLFKVLKEA
jgi:hypothetical protein